MKGNSLKPKVHSVWYLPNRCRSKPTQYGTDHSLALECQKGVLQTGC